MKRSRTILAAAAPLTLLVTMLTACSGAPSDPVNSVITADARGDECATAGNASRSVTVDGEQGASLSLTSSTPAQSDELQRSVLIEGAEEPFADGVDAELAVTIFNGKNGELVNHVPGDTLPNDAEQLGDAGWAFEAVRCGAPGQRVALVVPAGEAIGGDPAEAGFDLTEDDSFVIVIDFLETCETLVPRDARYPEIDRGDGSTEPEITIPECMEPPTELEVTVLEEGDGPVVESGQTINTRYVGVKWDGAQRFDGNWSGEGLPFDTTQGRLIDGFTQAMVGQKIGSTILVTMPPELGYGVGTGHELADETLTFVLQLVSLA